MDFESDFGDPTLEKAGVWVDYPGGAGDPEKQTEPARVRIGRLGNPAFREKHDKLMKPYADMERRGTLPSDTYLKVICRAYIGTILFEWSGFTAGGKPLPYDDETAYRMLTTRQSFRDTVTGLASQEENFRKARIDDTAKN